MNDINKYVFSGNLTKDPEIVQIPNSSTTYLRMTVACNESYKSGNEWKEAPNYLYCQIFGKKIDWLKKNLKMGTLVFCEGKIRVRNWKDNSGNWNTSWSIIVNNIRFPIQATNKMADVDTAPPPGDDDYYADNSGFGDQGMPADYYVDGSDFTPEPPDQY